MTGREAWIEALLRRVRIAWRFRVLPWQLPHGWRYLSPDAPTEADIARGEELARLHDWNSHGGDDA